MWDPTADSPFDRLPDDVVLHIFETLRDAKSLSVCTAVCKRFHSLAPQTHSLLLSIPASSASHSHSARARHTNPLLVFATKFLIRPFRSLMRFIESKSPFECTCRETAYNYYSPAYILRNFSEIRRLELRLPRQESCVRDGSALKWTAEFGSELQSCVIVGGTSISPIPIPIPSRVTEEEEEEEEGSGENEELKLRIFWTISCLIAATSRHSLLLETVNDHRTVGSVTVTDELGQGRLTMNAKQIEQVRRRYMKTKEEDEKCVVMADDRTRVPALKIKMWIAEELELPEAGCVMKGATLVVIRPAEQESAGVSEQAEQEQDLEVELGQTEGTRLFLEAANKLVKLKKSYTLDMNSF
nr:F-box protein At4g18380-like [Ipomoea batatas]